ncbi:MAG TPA: hypothetical protein VFW62_06720, partial [bacterium]|nr:hypothetical protein [bacterium]
EQSQQAQQADQAKQAQDAQRAQAEQLKQSQQQAKQEQPSTMSFEFMSAFETIFQEGYENYRVPQSSGGAATNTETRGQDLQRDMQVIREFFREASRLFAGQKMEISQMLNHLKAEQGGMFWSRLQQVLQKGIPVHQAVVFQKTDKDAGDIKHKFGSPEIPVALGEKAGEASKLGQMARPGSAMLELMRAEANPTTQVEHAVLALQILQHDGMTDSSQKVISYLKKRWGLSDEQMQRFLADHKIPFYMGPMVTADAGERSRGSFWYILVALASVPVAMLVGMDLLWSAIIGIAILGFGLILSAQKKD